MSILIKGMEMPKPGAYICELGVLDENTAVLTFYTPIDEPQKSYKIVPVPDHGRLIDADALTRAQGLHDYKYENGLVYVSVCEVVCLINAAPTIIPADLPKEEV